MWLPSWNIDEISLLRGYPAKKQVRYHCYVVTELKNRRYIAIVMWLPSWKTCEILQLLHGYNTEKTGEILQLLHGYRAEKQVKNCNCYMVIQLKNRWNIILCDYQAEKFMRYNDLYEIFKPKNRWSILLVTCVTQLKNKWRYIYLSIHTLLYCYDLFSHVNTQSLL